VRTIVIGKIDFNLYHCVVLNLIVFVHVYIKIAEEEGGEAC